MIDAHNELHQDFQWLGKTEAEEKIEAEAQVFEKFSVLDPYDSLSVIGQKRASTKVEGGRQDDLLLK